MRASRLSYGFVGLLKYEYITRILMSLWSSSDVLFNAVVVLSSVVVSAWQAKLKL